MTDVRQPQPRAVILVRNTVTYDARVQREAETLAKLGHDTVIVGVVSTAEVGRRARHAGVPILRLAPQSPLSRLRRRVQAVAGARGAASNPRGDRRGGRSGVPARAALRLHRWWTTLDYYRLLIGVVRAQRPVLVHCNDYNTLWAGAIARWVFGAAVVYDAHELWPDRNGRTEPRWLLLAVEWLLVRAAHRVTTTSPGHAEVMTNRYRIGRPVVIRNVSRAGARALPEARHRRPDRPPTAVYVGGVLRERGLEESIAAIGRLPDVRLLVVGPGPAAYRSELLGHARRHGVEERVRFAGPVAPGAVGEVIQEADVGLALIKPVCLSYRLALPNKLFEYLAAGLPILASDLPVMAEFIQAHGIGELVAPDDLAATAVALARLLEPDVNRAYREAVSAAAAALTWERERAELERVYAEALGSSRR